MPLITLNAKLENAKAIKGMRGKWAGVKKAAMTSVAQAWLDRIFPEHFSASNRSKYQMEKRNRFYKMVVKRIEGEGEGKTTDLVLKGKSRRYLKHSARITATQERATLRMSGPSYFANPFVGLLKKEITNQQGRTYTKEIRITRQPDKVKELTQVSSGDRRLLTAYLREEIRNRVKELTKG